MFHTIEEAIKDLLLGKIVVVVDDEDRENEGDFVALSEFITPETINFMITHGRGLVCTSITAELAEKLELPLMTNNNSDPYGTAFTVSIDHQDSTTGISAFERAHTIKQLIQKHAHKDEFKRPGHVFPLIAKQGGVLTRQGHTEASVDLAKIAGVTPSAVICEIVKPNGRMARVPDLEQICQHFDLKMISIKDLVAYQKKNQLNVKREVETILPTSYGDFNIIGYSNTQDDKEHLALIQGDITKESPVLLRIHSECLTGDVFHSKRCDCGPQLDKAMETIQQQGSGVILYLRQEGRSIGLFNKLKAYQLQDQGLDTVEANVALGFSEDDRDYQIATVILQDLGIEEVRLMTNNPDKVSSLEANDIKVTERISLETKVFKENERYLQTKKEKMGHLLSAGGNV